MSQHTFIKDDVKILKLDEELEAVGLTPLWMSHNPPHELIINFELELTPEQLLLADEVVADHVANNDLRRFIKIINEYRDAYLYSGITYAGYKFDTQADSFTNIGGTATGLNTLAILGQPLPETVPWTVANNNEALMAPAEFFDFALKVMNWSSNVYSACRYIKDDIITAYLGGDKTVLAVDYKSDSRWPTRDLGGSIALPLREKPFNSVAA